MDYKNLFAVSFGARIANDPSLIEAWNNLGEEFDAMLEKWVAEYVESDSTDSSAFVDRKIAEWIASVQEEAPDDDGIEVEVVGHCTCSLKKWVKVPELSKECFESAFEEAFYNADFGDGVDIDGELTFVYDEKGQCLYDYDEEDEEDDEDDDY